MDPTEQPAAPVEASGPPDAAAEGFDHFRELAAALGDDPSGLVVAMLTAFDRLGLALAIKEGATGRYVHANAAMVDAIGHGTPLVGSTDAEWLDPAQAATWRLAEQTALTQTVATTAEHHLERGGVRRQYGITRLPIGSAGGGLSRHLLVVWTDQTAANHQRRQLRHALAQIEQQQLAGEALRRQIESQGPRDTATGLYRPVPFEDQLRREIDLSSREHREFALVSIALDPPSKAVAAHGEAGRARILEALGQLLRSNTRAMDASSRLDEDRFAILLSGVGLATAHSRMEGLRRQCATQIVVIDGREIGFTIAMGVASFPHTAHTEAELAAASAAALLEAQRRGGNHVALASIRFVGPAGD